MIRRFVWHPPGMRRLTAALVGSLLVVTACASDDDSTDSSTSDPVTTTATTAESAAESTPDTEPSSTEAAPPATDRRAHRHRARRHRAGCHRGATCAELPSIGLGEYDVGVSTITITDPTRNRPLTVDVWFPLADDVSGDPHRYTFVTGDYYESPQAVSAEPASISPDGPFPLVVYSHGSGGTRYNHSNYTETIASHGYLVVAPDHTGNTAVERVLDSADDPSVIALNRPQDIRVVIEAMVNPESPETAGFVAAADPERVAVTGHSFGGFTAYASAAGYANELGEVGPEPLLDAIIPLAPAVGGDDPADQLLSDGRLIAVQVPSLVMVGTNDQTTPIDPNVERAWELNSSDPHYRLELVDAQHQTFSDVCAYLDFLPSLPEASDAVLQALEPLGAEGCRSGRHGDPTRPGADQHVRDLVPRLDLQGRRDDRARRLRTSRRHQLHGEMIRSARRPERDAGAGSPHVSRLRSRTPRRAHGCPPRRSIRSASARFHGRRGRTPRLAACGTRS